MTLSDSATVAAISLLVTTILNYYYRSVQQRSDRRAAIELRTGRLIELALEYPHLERDSFVAAWSPTDQSDDAVRYDNYCCYVFNLLETLHRHYQGDGDKMHAVLAYPELIRKHAHWWRTSPGVESGYNHDFRCFVEVELNRRAE